MTEPEKGLARRDPVERIERFQALEPGYYWRATKDVEVECEGYGRSTVSIPDGEVLLLLDVRCYDEKTHTVILREHPRDGDGSYRMLVDDFLAAFEPELKGDEIRGRELAEVENEIRALQEDVLTEQTDPKRLEAAIAEDLVHWEEQEAQRETRENKSKNGRGKKSRALVAPSPATVSVPDTLAMAIASGVSEKSVHALHHAVARQAKAAELRGKHMERRTEEISEALERIKPFVSERAAIALARTQGMRRYAERVADGLKSLDLYTGRGVEVVQLTDGEGAPAGAPLSIFQRKLFMDEELAVFCDVERHFDFSNTDRFDESLAEHPALIDQLIPAPRGVLAMATRRQDVDYGSGDPWAAAIRNIRNKTVFLLVRDGAKVYRVWSSEPSHEGAPRLFPRKDEIGEVFRGWDGSEVTFQDLAFTDRAEAADRLALHYKRFLILLCGLDHRLSLFGRFYPEAEQEAFLKHAFQERYLRFIADDEPGTLIGEGYPAVKAWIAEKNAYLRSGSRIYAYHPDLTDDEEIAPACFVYNSMARGYRRVAGSTKAHGVHIARREGREFVIDIEVDRSKYTWAENPSRPVFNARVRLSSKPRHRLPEFLCLDAVKCAEIEHYIHDREARIEHIGYLRMFKAAAEHLRAEEAAEAGTRAHLAEALRAGDVAGEDAIPRLVDEAVRTWRAEHRGAPLPSASSLDRNTLNSVLDGMHAAASEEDLSGRLDAYIEKHGLVPLRAARRGKRLALYVEVPETERHFTLIPWGWVRRLTLEPGKRTLRKTGDGLAWLERDKADAREKILREWGACDEWLHEKAAPFRPGKPCKMREAVAASLAYIPQWLPAAGGTLSEDMFEDLSRRLRRLMRNHVGRMVPHVHLFFPIGILYRERKREPHYLALRVEAPFFMRDVVTKEQRETLRSDYASVYANHESALARFDKSDADLTLAAIPAKADVAGLCMDRQDDYGWRVIGDSCLDEARKGGKTLAGQVERLAKVCECENARWDIVPGAVELAARLSRLCARAAIGPSGGN